MQSDFNHATFDFFSRNLYLLCDYGTRFEHEVLQEHEKVHFFWTKSGLIQSYISDR